jgi:glutaredoxin 3
MTLHPIAPKVKDSDRRRLRRNDMVALRKVEVFSAGCGVCDDVVKMVNSIACTSCDVSVLDMKDMAVVQRAKSLGIKRVPAVVVDGKVADCCSDRGPTETSLRAAGIGHAKS